MTTVDLYKWTTETGEVIVSPIKPTKYEYTTDMVRLIADAKKILVNGDTKAICIDILKTDVDKWTEQDMEQSAN